MGKRTPRFWEICRIEVIIKVKLLYSIWISVECIYERLSYFDVLVIKFILESLK